MSSLLAGFGTFIKHLRIETKDEGVVPLRLLGSQKLLLREIKRGLAEDVHTFVVLKARQLGISTLGLALDLFAVSKHPGLQATLVTDTDDNRDVFRSIIAAYMDSLPRAMQVEKRLFNRYQLVLQNRSRCVFQVAGTRRKGGLGRGKAINFAHLSELSSWGDPEGFGSLRSSFSNRYPNRLYLLESTARGFNNLFEKVWNDAESAVTMRGIFIGWWARDDYRAERGSRIYDAYGRECDAEENEWCALVEALYGVTIDDEQMAWWRWYEAEVAGSREIALQEMPFFAEQAFVMGGATFFDHEKLRTMLIAARASEPPQQFSYLFGAEFRNTQIMGVPEGELSVWEMPHEGATYVLGADPAYGASDTSDFHAVEVFRCYADGVEQVAELRTRSFRTYELAWAVAHLAGAYRGRLNLELTGPGLAVWQELQRIAEIAPMQESGNDAEERLRDFLGGISHYFYHRADSLGNSMAYHTKTSSDIKVAYMNALRDSVERGKMVVHSLTLINEMRNIRTDGDFIGAAGRGNDDIVIAAALANAAWLQFELTMLVAAGRSRQAEQDRERGVDPMHTHADRLVRGFLERVIGPTQ